MRAWPFILCLLGGILLLVADAGPRPNPPGPQPPGPPPAPVVAPPIPGAGFSVLIVEETSDHGKISKAQLSALYAVPVRKFFRDNSVDFRIWDPDVDASFADSKWREALSHKRDSLPWIYISNGKTGFSGPLPKNMTDLLALLERYKTP